LDRMALRWKGLLLGAPKKAIIYHLIDSKTRSV